MTRCALFICKTIAVLAMTATAAFAQSIGGPQMPQQETHSNERLAMPMFPTGWERTELRSGDIEIYEYYPKGQSPATWAEKIVLEVRRGANNLPIDAYQRRASSQARDTCEDILEGKLQTGVNNGFPAAYWMRGCKKDKRGNFGDLRYTKAIQGGQTLYLLSRAWRTPPYSDQGPPLPANVINEARDFLGSSVVCASSGNHPCPDEAKQR